VHNDHNFLRFSTIFGEKIVIFLKNLCCDKFFEYFSCVLSKKQQNFCRFFVENIFKITTLVPDWTNFRLFSCSLLWAVFENYKFSPNFRTDFYDNYNLAFFTHTKDKL
jgi:hypothetical protein